jgi:hypothetical protein
VLTEHIYVFSRMLLNDSHMFLQLMAASAPVLDQTEAILYDTLMGVWWEKVILCSRLSLKFILICPVSLII